MPLSQDELWRVLDDQLRKVYGDPGPWWDHPQGNLGRLTPRQLWELGCMESLRAAVDNAIMQAGCRARVLAGIVREDGENGGPT